MKFDAIRVQKEIEDTRSSLGELIRHDESRTDEKLRQMIATADAEADRLDGRTPKAKGGNKNGDD